MRIFRRSSIGSRFDGKRVFDVSAAGVILIFCWPLLAVLAIAVRLNSRGPAFFRQVRVGRFGKTFRIHKFRTMRVEGPGSLVSRTGDPRITRVGKVLRRTKLDELPQLIDVLLGDMSLVGPRPEVPQYVALWNPDDRDVILSCRPGITDPASIELRNESDELAAVDDPEAYYVENLLPRKTALYVEYVRARTFGGDLIILFRTIRAVARI